VLAKEVKTMTRPTIAKIDLAAIDANLKTLTMHAASPKVIAVVKADAYGNGAVEVAKRLASQVDMLAVAFLSEAIELRDAGILQTILILQGPHHSNDLYISNTYDLVWMLHSEWQLDAYDEFEKSGKASELKHKAWLKFDTGMHRLGLHISKLEHIFKDYASFVNEQSVLCTHLANADEVRQDDAKRQIALFLEKVEGLTNPLCIANSATHARFAHARQEYVRLGIAMYGSTPFQAQDNPLSLQAVMSLNTQIIALRKIPKGDSVGYGSTWRAVRESLIATVAIGYADGYPRHAPTGTPAWCNNSIINLVGRVSMDMLTFDVTDLASVSIGDTVQLWGDKLEINQVADHIGTIGYELMTRVSKRVPREYLHSKK
jgi:alanine racemase